MPVGGGVSRTNPKDLVLDENTGRQEVELGDIGSVPSKTNTNKEALLVISDKPVEEILDSINKQLCLLNARFEEAFRTGLNKGDISNGEN